MKPALPDIMEVNVHASDNSSAPPIAILGIPFDNVTTDETVARIEQMVASGNPHYLATANVDFLVQALSDVELRRILLEAHLVLCDGTPLLWASRVLGNPLPERVAGSDLVPLLIQIAAMKKYRVFFLGGAAETLAQATANVRARFPEMIIAGCYSPPFASLLEMDHEEITQRIRAAKPDLLFIAFGCPKQEKWIAMHYRRLGVPVCVGVGATIDFLAGKVRRAPRWMRRTGTEWIFRLAQEPRRLCRRYLRDMALFSRAILEQWWRMQTRAPDEEQPASNSQHPTPDSQRAAFRHSIGGWLLDVGRWMFSSARPAAVAPDQAMPASPRRDAPGEGKKAGPPAAGPSGARVESHAIDGEKNWRRVRLSERLDVATARRDTLVCEDALARARYLLLDTSRVHWIDSTGVGLLVHLQKRARIAGGKLLLLSPGVAVQSALRLMRLEDFFTVVRDMAAARQLMREIPASAPVLQRPNYFPWKPSLFWRGEITAANAEQVWQSTAPALAAHKPPERVLVDLSGLEFIDSSGVGLMIRARKDALELGLKLVFVAPTPNVLNVLRLSHSESFLLGDTK